MQSLITWMLEDSHFTTFCEYFQTYYAKRVEQWAYCYRVGTPANTNMCTESFHRLLKTVYFDGKQNRKIDQLLSILLRIARDKAYDKLIKDEKGKLTYRMKEVNKCHALALELAHSPVNKGENEWEIQSTSSTRNVTYVIRVL